MCVKDIYKSILQFDKKKVSQQVKEEIDKGTELEIILNEGLISPLDEVGQKFKSGELFMPEMLLAAKTMKVGLEILRPLLDASGSKDKGVVVIGTVEGDLHDIGKNLVRIMLEGGGFTVIDIGVDAKCDQFIKAVEEHQADVVAMSALLTTTMPMIESNVKIMKDHGLGAKIIIGGAPVTKSFAEDVGADGYSDDAPGAVELVNNFTEQVK